MSEPGNLPVQTDGYDIDMANHAEIGSELTDMPLVVLAAANTQTLLHKFKAVQLVKNSQYNVRKTMKGIWWLLVEKFGQSPSFDWEQKQLAIKIVDVLIILSGDAKNPLTSWEKKEWHIGKMRTMSPNKDIDLSTIDINVLFPQIKDSLDSITSWFYSPEISRIVTEFRSISGCSEKSMMPLEDAERKRNLVNALVFAMVQHVIIRINYNLKTAIGWADDDKIFFALLDIHACRNRVVYTEPHHFRDDLEREDFLKEFKACVRYFADKNCYPLKKVKEVESHFLELPLNVPNVGRCIEILNTEIWKERNNCESSRDSLQHLIRAKEKLQEKQQSLSDNALSLESFEDKVGSVIERGVEYPGRNSNMHTALHHIVKDSGVGKSKQDEGVQASGQYKDDKADARPRIAKQETVPTSQIPASSQIKPVSVGPQLESDKDKLNRSQIRRQKRKNKKPQEERKP